MAGNLADRVTDEPWADYAYKPEGLLRGWGSRCYKGRVQGLGGNSRTGSKSERGAPRDPFPTPEQRLKVYFLEKLNKRSSGPGNTGAQKMGERKGSRIQGD